MSLADKFDAPGDSIHACACSGALELRVRPLLRNSDEDDGTDGLANTSLEKMVGMTFTLSFSDPKTQCLQAKKYVDQLLCPKNNAQSVCGDAPVVLRQV